MEVACTAKRNFDRECKKTFATKSAMSGHFKGRQNFIRSLHPTRLTGPHLPACKDVIVRQPTDVCKLGHDIVDKRQADKRATRLRLIDRMLGSLAVEPIGDFEPGRTIKRLDITCLHPDPNGSLDRILPCCVRWRWQVDAKDIDRDVLPWSLSDEAVCDKKEADVGLAVASKDQLIQFDSEELVVAGLGRRTQKPQDSGAVETRPRNVREGG